MVWTVCYKDSFIYIHVCVCVCVMFVPYRKHTYGPPRLLGDSSTFLYADDVHSPQRPYL
jgi:hypothetical protein